ncbi:MAG: hypothetical protein ACRDK1_09390 [Solirubrobacterales bacterium]
MHLRGLLGGLWISLWLLAIWAVVLYVFFTTLASISPVKVAALTVVTTVIALLVVIRNVRVASELAHPGGNPAVRRALNRQRERRGF